MRVHYLGFLESGEFPWRVWRRYWKAEGTRVRVTAPGATTVGRVMGLSPEGALIVESDETGEEVAVLAGDVTSLDPAD